MGRIARGAILIAIGIIIGTLVQPLVSEDTVYNQIKKISFVLNTALKNYVEDVDTQKLTEAAIKGMLEELDVHSVYIPPEQMKKVKEDFQGSFDGIGVEFDILNDTITIVSPIPGGPSEALGIMSGDKIVKIDGEDVIGISREEVPKKLKGPKGTIVEVDIKRAAERELLHYTIKRDKIPINSIETSFIIENTNIGFIHINRFSETTHDEFAEAIRNLNTKGLKSLILDLRGNPGGFLNQAFMLADEFIPTGNKIVYTKGRRPQFDEVYTSNPGGMFEKMPLIVLIDAGSASASEIVSGAIQDLDRGLILGVTSYGKGLVQRQFGFENDDGSAFRLTISKYYTPSGRCIQRPYKNKEEYRDLVGRLDLEEGSNIEHSLDKLKEVIKKEKKDIAIDDNQIIISYPHEGKKKKQESDTLPIYRTKKGRLVLGGGGITPDYVMKYDTITKLSRNLLAKNCFYEFDEQFMSGKGNSLRHQYKQNFNEFFADYSISDQMVGEFKKFAKDKSVEWNEEQYEKDKRYIKMMIKANVARSIWDRSKLLQVYYSDDSMVRKALDLFPEAEKIAGLK